VRVLRRPRVPDPPDQADGGRSWLLRVEFSGRIVEHEHGWRAERQRVLDVVAPATCYECDARPTHVSNVGGFGNVAVCDAHAALDRLRFVWPPPPAGRVVVPFDEVVASLGVPIRRP